MANIFLYSSFNGLNLLLEKIAYFAIEYKWMQEKEKKQKKEKQTFTWHFFVKV